MEAVLVLTMEVTLRVEAAMATIVVGVINTVPIVTRCGHAVECCTLS